MTETREGRRRTGLGKIQGLILVHIQGGLSAIILSMNRFCCIPFSIPAFSDHHPRQPI